jgi:lipoprotein-anchoring transpeptidase ErfK/SrfK
MSARRSLVRWLAVTVVIAAVGVTVGNLVRQKVAHFGVAMNPPDGSVAIDPRQALSLEALGVGARLKDVVIRYAGGRVIDTKADSRHAESVSPLAFGSRYQIRVTVERPWFGQRLEHNFSVATVEQPRLEGRTERTLDPDGSITLQFDQPVGTLETASDVPFVASADVSHRTFKLSAEHYPAGQTFPVQVNMTTTTGVPLPPLTLAVTTAQPLSARITPQNLTDLGLAMPVEVTFSEPVADRADIGQHFVVQTQDGNPVSGKWFWYNSTRLRFAPTPTWPARSTIEVKFNPDGVKSLQGGMINTPLAATFSTGTDRKIFVYLDRQQLAAVENGEVVKTFKVSTGKAKTPTVTGSFYIYARFPLKTMRSRAKPGQQGHYVVENVPFAQYFHADYAFHGAWWHNGFGHPASHGCVNMSTRNHNRRWPGASEDAGWLYRWATLGVPVTVYRNAPSQTQVAMKE